jgi:hypothetical protein
MNEYTILIARVGVVDDDPKNVPMLDTVARLFIIYSLSTNDLPRCHLLNFSAFWDGCS